MNKRSGPLAGLWQGTTNLAGFKRGLLVRMQLRSVADCPEVSLGQDERLTGNGLPTKEDKELPDCDRFRTIQPTARPGQQAHEPLDLHPRLSQCRQPCIAVTLGQPPTILAKD